MRSKEDIYTISASETRVPNIVTLAQELEKLDEQVRERFDTLDIREAARKKSMTLLGERK